MTITAADVRNTEFRVSARFKRGYVATEVNSFVERIAERLESGTGVSSNDVYHVTFTRAAMADRGYAEDEVDDFLDRIHAELLRREDAWGHQPAPADVDPHGAPDPEPPAAPD